MIVLFALLEILGADTCDFGSDLLNLGADSFDLSAYSFNLRLRGDVLDMNLKFRQSPFNAHFPTAIPTTRWHG